MALAFLVCGTNRAVAEFIVWDYGPTTGPATPPEGNRSVFVNMSNGQNFLDTVSFAADTSITGLNLFTSSSRLPPHGDLYHVRFRQDAGGVPGAVFSEFDVPATAIDFIGDFKTTTGNPADVYRVSLRFDAVHLAAGTTYWTGASGLNFDIGTYGVVGPGPGRTAQLSGSQFLFINTITGDLMFQLVSDTQVGTVPEPSSVLLLTGGLAVLGCFARARRWFATGGVARPAASAALPSVRC
jgi:hypothetical protein